MKTTVALEVPGRGSLQEPPRPSTWTLDRRAWLVPAVLGVAWLVWVWIVATAIRSHEPWFDEAQAWLLARDLNWTDLMLRHVRYEGSPGLWHTLLWVAQRAGLPFVGFGVVSGVAAAAGTALFLWFGPFPLWFRVLFPFTFFPLYQYAVIARSYSLYFPLLCLTALLWPVAERRVFTFAFLLCLLSNVSVHGVMISCGIAVGIAVRVSGGWSDLHRSDRRRYLMAAALFTSGLLLVVLQVASPPDLSFHPEFRFHPLAIAGTAARMLSNSMTGSLIGSALVLGGSTWWFWRRGVLAVWLVSGGLLCLLFGVKYANVWHEGTIVLLWMFCLWISNLDRKVPWPRPLTALVAATLVIQLAWSASTVRYDLDHTYSGSRDAAKYLQTHLQPGDRVYALGYPAMALQPYFPTNIYGNYDAAVGGGYWFWSTRNRMDESFDAVRTSHPKFVVVSLRNPVQDQLLTAAGYGRRGHFEGGLVWKGDVLEPESFDIWSREPLK